MKILYALQATGNGHISRANEILPILETMATVDVLLSGKQADIGLNHTIKYKKKGLSFVFGKKGGIDFYKTIRQMKGRRFLQEMRSITVGEYDLVINDFEPLSAWACRKKNVPCVSLSHQYAVIHKYAPLAKQYDPFATLLLKYYAPCTSGIGFHFSKYSTGIFGPVIRSEIRHAYVRNLGHYSVYLPAYSDKRIIKGLSKYRKVQWHIFSKHAVKSYATGNCWIRPVNNYDFISSCSTAEGILCAAGFETPAEALFMKKKLLVVPMKHQYEQHCNAAALKQLGVPVLKRLDEKHSKEIAKWIDSKEIIPVDFADETRAALLAVLSLAGFEQKVSLPIRPALTEPSNTMQEFAGIA